MSFDLNDFTLSESLNTRWRRRTHAHRGKHLINNRTDQTKISWLWEEEEKENVHIPSKKHVLEMMIEINKNFLFYLLNV
jgi:hypothetical protein